MSKTLLLATAAVAALAIIGISASARAQVPPHYPGSVCFTPNFWCWISPPQAPNTSCFCASPYGPVSGEAG